MRKYISTLLLGASLAAASTLAQAAWPDRPIKMVIGSLPGGSNDYVGRVFSEFLARELGQAVVIDNKPGAGSSIGVDLAAKAPPDGYTLTVAAPGAIAVNPVLDSKWAAARNMVPVAMLSTTPLVISVNPQLGVKSIRELIEYSKKNPGKLNFAHPGQGTPTHLAGILFNQQAGTDLVAVPFKSGGEAAQSVIAGDSHVTFATPPSVIPFFKTGRMLGLATTSPNRSALAPDIPGMKETSLPDYKMDFWYILYAPQGTPPEVVKKLADAANAIVRKPEYKSGLASGGMDLPQMMSSTEFASYLQEDLKLWEKLARDSSSKAKD